MTNEKKKGGSLGIMIIVGVLIFLLGGLALLITYNPGNINNTVLKNIPVLNMFVPKEEPINVDLSLEEKYYDYSKPALKDAVFELEKEKVILTDKIKKLNDESAEKDKEIAKLREYETLYFDIKKQLENKTEQTSVENKKDFAAYYERLNPEVAKQIYAEITKDLIVEKEVTDYINKLNEMDPNLVAQIMDDMIRTDFNQVVKILQNMDEDKSVKVLEAMDIKNTTKITKMLTGGIK